MVPHPRFVRCLLSHSFLGFLVLVVGCSDKSATPLGPVDGSAFPRRSPGAMAAGSATQAAGFYPLSVGNRWHYTRVFVLNYGGYGDTIQSSIDVVNIGSETWGDRAYLVEEETTTQDSRPGEVFRWWTRYRQDRNGLYYRNVCACEPPALDQGLPASAPDLATMGASADEGKDAVLANTFTPEELEIVLRGRAKLIARIEAMRREVLLLPDRSVRSTQGLEDNEPDEVALLHYPLHVGRSWQVRPGLDLFWTVEGVDMLTTPAGKFPAFEIDVSIPLASPGDFAKVWIGRAGRLAYRIHADVGGGFTGDETEVVDYLSISR